MPTGGFVGSLRPFSPAYSDEARRKDSATDPFLVGVIKTSPYSALIICSEIFQGPARVKLS
jgi:hypothetical protein